jgi:hypothetical protein
LSFFILPLALCRSTHSKEVTTLIFIVFVIAFTPSPCSSITSSRVFYSVGVTPRIAFSHAKEHAYEQLSFSPPPPQQGRRRCALFSLISVFVIIFIVIVIVVNTYHRQLGFIECAPHITRACAEGHPHYCYQRCPA